jgi:hypothetical protein
VFYEPNVTTVSQIVVRQSGTISCTVAPQIAILDLGTSATTSYASATKFSTLTTSTSDGVSSTGFGSYAAIGHYFGVGFAAGTCATAPTFDISITID